MPAFSICIPNFNYARYLQLTLDSVLAQQHPDFEICVADNHSTDGSQELIARYAAKDARIRYQFNEANLGFSDNLLVASGLAGGTWHILLSSDDLMLAPALETYQRFIDTLGPGVRFAFGASTDKIDGEGVNIGYVGPRRKTWRKEDIDPELSRQMGFDVYKVSAKDMLRRCLSTFYGYFNFASACYTQTSYAQAGAYAGGRMYGPDKWFHWRLLQTVDYVYFLDAPLFAYRWHTQNQAALQAKSRALKYLVDEYRNSFETTPEMLQLAGMDMAALQKAFIEEVIVKQAFSALKTMGSAEARRVLHFGKSCYPAVFSRSKHARAIQALAATGPLGGPIARLLKPDF